MKSILLMLALAVVLGASDAQYVMSAVYGRDRGGAMATKFTIYDADAGVTGYSIEISVCHPTQHGCITRRMAQTVEVEGTFGMATATFEVPPSQIEGEPWIVALPSGEFE
jgi:hypothetical protein